MLHAVTHQKVSTMHISQCSSQNTKDFFYQGIQGFSHLLFTLIFNKVIIHLLLLIICLANKTHFIIIIIILIPPPPRETQRKWFVLNCSTLMLANGLASVAERHRYYEGNTTQIICSSTSSPCPNAFSRMSFSPIKEENVITLNTLKAKTVAVSFYRYCFCSQLITFRQFLTQTLQVHNKSY